MSNRLRLLITLGMLVCGIFGVRAVALAAPSTTVEITDVYNALNTPDEWFQLYNMTKSAVTLDGWKVCNLDTCATIPSTKIEPFSLSKIKATTVTGWPANGLNGAADMVGILDDKGAPVDSMNWGTPDTGWKNYATFKDMLWNPGIKAPDAASNQSFFRMAIGNDTDKPGDWLTTSSKPVTADVTPVPSPTTAPVVPTATTAPQNPAAPTNTAAPAAPTNTAAPAAPTATATVAPSGGTTGGTGGSTGSGQQQPTGSTTPKTGGEFPIFIALALVAALLVIRYARRSVRAGSRN